MKTTYILMGIAAAPARPRAVRERLFLSESYSADDFLNTDDDSWLYEKVRNAFETGTRSNTMWGLSAYLRYRRPDIIPRDAVKNYSLDPAIRKAHDLLRELGKKDEALMAESYQRSMENF